MKETLKTMKHSLISKVSAEMGNLDCVDTKELGEAIDMIKDLEEALYYCTIIEAMEGKDKESEPEVRNNNYYYTESKYVPIKDWDYYRDMDRPYGMMYYSGGNTSSSGGMNQDSRNSFGMRDSREGRSPASRRQYMESKEMHMDKTTQLKDLEKYMQELTTDIAEMIDQASPDEKQLVQKKISSLAAKIEQMK